MADIVLHVGEDAKDVVERLEKKFPGQCKVEKLEKHVGGDEIALFIQHSPQIVIALTAMIGVIKGKGVWYQYKKGEHLLQIDADGTPDSESD